MNKNDFSLDVGKSEKLEALYSPSNTSDDKNLTWTSDNKDVATVDQDGTVTGISSGTAKIIATGANGTSASARVTVQVPISSLTLDYESYELTKGESFKLTANIMPDTYTDTVAWSSSDTSIASVDQNGTVSAESVGQAVISITSSRGSSASCTINVTIPATEIKLKNIPDILHEGQN